MGHVFSVISYELLQPVHSLPLLITTELGVPAALFTASVILYGEYALIKRKANNALLLSGMLLFLSLFDHYFWTLQQGQLLLAFCIAMTFILSPKASEKIEKTTISKAVKRKI